MKETREIKGPDRRSDKEKRKALLDIRNNAQDSAMELVNALHDAGFSNLLLESTQITGNGHYFLIVVINETEIGSDRLFTLQKVARKHEASISVRELRLNNQSVSRISLWPEH